ncbi:MAG: hypothetical protein OXG56_00800, partial [Gammaproteobacteria bacterium]|nr:hypothetical protein [Gammaproteobacteria bacterium]
MTPASDSEHGPCQAGLRQHLDSPLGSRTRTFVADRGLDNDTLRATAYRAGVLPVIQSRQLWQDQN